MTYLDSMCAYERFYYGEKPSYSIGICGQTTAGYGKLDSYGYWEFPLDVDQETLRIIPPTEIIKIL